MLNTNSRQFRSFLFDASFIDLGFKGFAFTWTKKSHTAEAVHVHLDKKIACGHCPILLITRGSQGYRGVFRVEN
jgi:hypothetical protein